MQELYSQAMTAARVFKNDYHPFGFEFSHQDINIECLWNWPVRIWFYSSFRLDSYPGVHRIIHELPTRARLKKIFLDFNWYSEIDS